MVKHAMTCPFCEEEIEVPAGVAGTTELKDCGPDITLRDRIAYHALEGMLAHARGHHGDRHGYLPRMQDKGLHWHEAIAKEAYEIADAMMRERGSDEVL